MSDFSIYVRELDNWIDLPCKDEKLKMLIKLGYNNKKCDVDCPSAFGNELTGLSILQLNSIVTKIDSYSPIQKSVLHLYVRNPLFTFNSGFEVIDRIDTDDCSLEDIDLLNHWEKIIMTIYLSFNNSLKTGIDIIKKKNYIVFENCEDEISACRKYLFESLELSIKGMELMDEFFDFESYFYSLSESYGIICRCNNNVVFIECDKSQFEIKE